jgi:hypothetical protein
MKKQLLSIGVCICTISIGSLYAKDGMLGQGVSFYKCPEVTSRVVV